MAINTSWKLEIGTLASPSDFTSRVMSMNIRQTVDVNVIGRGQAVFTLLNKDGALTPGGGGTYSSTDWFAQGVFITALTNTGGADTSTAVFHGVVVDFDLQDDGVYSTVTITAVDGLSIGGRTRNVALPVALTTNYSSAADAALGGGFAVGYAINYPRLGASAALSAHLNLSSSNPLVTIDTSVYSTAADMWQTALIPSVNDVMWATVIIGTVTAFYNVRSVADDNTRATVYRTDFVFDPSSAVSGTDLPFAADTFTQAFNNDTLITTAQIQGSYAGATTDTSTATTVNTYGDRTVAFTDCWVADSTASAREATLLTNRYSTSRFNPVSLSLSASMVKARSADAAHAKWYTLLSIADGLWQKATVTWQGSGAAQQTANCVIYGRTINVTPSDTVVTLGLKNWIDNHGFILDTDTLGGTPVYDSGIQYDESGDEYDDTSVADGERLG
jgi:hypothetical protein